MEPDDFLPNEVDVGGPEVDSVWGINRGEVVKEGVDPDVDAVRLVAWHADAKGGCGVVGDRAGNRHVVEAFAQAA